MHESQQVFAFTLADSQFQRLAGILQVRSRKTAGYTMQVVGKALSSVEGLWHQQAAHLGCVVDLFHMLHHVDQALSIVCR